jgi:TRAP-type C4-dicarboxylate transport system permease large subunit
MALGTPPYGQCLFITSAVSSTPLKDVIREMLNFLVFEFIGLMIVTFVPDTVLWIPRLAGYKG